MRTVFLLLLLSSSLNAQDALQDARNRLKDLLPSETVPVAPEQPETPSVEPPKAGVTFAMVAAAPPVPERYLAVGDFCPACPAGKEKFLSSGGKPENIVDWRVAHSQYGQRILVIPSEFSITPAAQPDQVVATAEGINPSAEAVVVIVSEYLAQQTEIQRYKSLNKSTDPDKVTYGGWFDYTVDVPDLVPSLLQKLMKDKSYTNDKLGLSVLWPGTQTLKLSPASITITPAIQVSVKKFGITASASVSEVRFSSDYKTVTVITPEVLIPDLTINFK